MNGKIVLRIVSALVLIAAIAGIAFFAFNAGVAQGSPVTVQAPAGQTAPAALSIFWLWNALASAHSGLALVASACSSRCSCSSSR